MDRCFMSHLVKSNRGPLPQRLEWIYLDSRSYESEYAQYLNDPASLKKKMVMVAELLRLEPHLLATKSYLACKRILCTDPGCRYIHSFAVYEIFNRILNEKIARHRNQMRPHPVVVRYVNLVPLVQPKENPHPEGQSEGSLLQCGFEAGASFITHGCQSKKWKKRASLLPLESPKKSSSLTEH